MSSKFLIVFNTTGGIDVGVSNIMLLDPENPYHSYLASTEDDVFTASELGIDETSVREYNRLSDMCEKASYELWEVLYEEEARIENIQQYWLYKATTTILDTWRRRKAAIAAWHSYVPPSSPAIVSDAW